MSQVTLARQCQPCQLCLRQVTGDRDSGVQQAGQAERAAEALLKMGTRAVLITGGDADSGLAADLLLDVHGATVFSAERIKSKHTHGTGCTLGSALACLLARERVLPSVVRTS